jgi:hypothetical protein
VTEDLVRRYRSEIPRAHAFSLDTRIQWLWNQRFGTIQTVWLHSPDAFDKVAATMFLQAILGADLDSMKTIFQRLEGGAQSDEDTTPAEARL